MEIRANRAINVDVDPQNCITALMKEWYRKTSNDPCAYMENGRWMVFIPGANEDYIGEMGTEFLREATQEELKIDAAFNTLMAAFEK